MEQLLIGIFCDIDEFCKAFEEYWQQHLVTDGRAIIPKCSMSLSEIMTIVVFFHLSNRKPTVRHCSIFLLAQKTFPPVKLRRASCCVVCRTQVYKQFSHKSSLLFYLRFVFSQKTFQQILEAVSIAFHRTQVKKRRCSMKKSNFYAEVMLYGEDGSDKRCMLQREFQIRNSTTIAQPPCLRYIQGICVVQLITAERMILWKLLTRRLGIIYYPTSEYPKRKPPCRL